MNRPYARMNRPYARMNRPYARMNRPYARMNRPYTRRRLGGRQPLCGTGVISAMERTLMPTL